MKCDACDGQGWTAKHYPHCDGNCYEWGCPAQVQCEKCNGTGEVDDETTSESLLRRARDAVHERTSTGKTETIDLLTLELCREYEIAIQMAVRLEAVNHKLIKQQEA